MGKKLHETIQHIMEENNTNKILILTNNLQIFGVLEDYGKDCKNCNETLISLKNVKIANQDTLCNCSDSCDAHTHVEYEWFNISIDSIVGFSVIK